MLAKVGAPRLLVVDRDTRLLSAISSASQPAIDVKCITFAELPANCVEIGRSSVLAIGIDQPSDLDVIVDLRRKSGVPPIIAMAGAGFGRRSLEHVLLLAELRGASATLIKPFEVSELALATFSVWNRRSGPPGNDATAHRRAG